MPHDSGNGTSTAAGDLLAAVLDARPIWWECPCGTVPPKHPDDPMPVRTLVALHEPRCYYCGREYRPEYEPGRRVEEPRPKPDNDQLGIFSDEQPAE